MSTLLLGLELLVAGVLWTALFMALAQRSPTRLRRWLTFAPAAALPLLGALALAGGDLFLADHVQLPTAFRATVWLLFLGQIGATGMIVFYGFRDFRLGTLPATPWPRLPVFIGLCAALLVHLISLQSIGAAASSELLQARVQTSAAAVALVPGDLPADQNAFADYEQAVKLYRGCNDSPADAAQFNLAVAAACSRPAAQLDSTGAPPPAPDPAYVPRYLAANRDCLAAILRGTQKPVCIDNLKYDQLRPDSNLDILWEMHKFSDLLLIDARAAVETHETARAIRDLSAHARLIAHLLERPVLLEFLLGCSMIDRHADALQTLLPALPLDPAAAQAMALPAELQIRESCRKSFVLEEAFGVGCFEFLQEKGGQDLSPDLAFLTHTALYFYRAYLLTGDLAEYRKRLQAAQQRIQQPNPPTDAEFDAVHFNRFEGLLTRLISPAMLMVTQRAYENQARIDLIRLALAAQVYRTQQGAWPASLAALQPTAATLWPAAAGAATPLPADPFSGQLYLYRLEDGAPLIYSVAVNRIDDQGLDTRAAPNTNTDDIALRLHPAPAPTTPPAPAATTPAP